MTVSFDGPNKLIIANNGTVIINVQSDIYSSWKQWMMLSDNSKYSQAMTVVGGDPIGGGSFIAPYFFLMNGWKLRPHEANHSLTINGTLLDIDGGSPFVPTIGNYNVMVNSVVPVRAEKVIIETGLSGVTELDKDQIADKVWQRPATIVPGSWGDFIANKLLTFGKWLANK